MSPEEKASRADKATELQVSPAGALWKVKSGSKKASYLVNLNSNPASCGCPDYQIHKNEENGWECKHILAAKQAAGISTEYETEVDTTDIFHDELASALEDIVCTRCERVKVYEAQVFTHVNSEQFGEELLCPECAEMRQYSLGAMEDEDTKEFGTNSQEEESEEEEGEYDSSEHLSDLEGIVFRMQGKIETLESLLSEVLKDGSSLGNLKLRHKISKANSLLEEGEPGNVEEYDRNGRKLKGYAIQSVIDVANRVLGPNGWRYALHKSERDRDGAIVQLELFIMTPDGWLSKGATFGGCQNPSYADALKGAIADAVKKSFSLWGLGSKAYRGEL